MSANAAAGPGTTLPARPALRAASASRLTGRWGRP